VVRVWEDGEFAPFLVLDLEGRVGGILIFWCGLSDFDFWRLGLRRIGLGLGWWPFRFAKKSIDRASGLYHTSGRGENKTGCALRSYVQYVLIERWNA
jgi:hypothetical protein